MYEKEFSGPDVYRLYYFEDMGRKRKIMAATPSSPLATSIRQKAYLFIQRKIAAGELAAGAAVSELEIAKELGSSRTPIREAISQLTAEGLLEQTPGGGVLVVRFTRDNIVDLCELREAWRHSRSAK
jgi:DNA-binding GntR family transcriptional regulator